VPRSEMGAGGVVHEARDVLAGQSWQRGQVIVAWDAVRDGAADPHDGTNVVMHEFAHQLDQDTGAANGAPYVGRGAQQAWARVMNQEFDALRARLARAEPGVIEPYAATNPAEFFAVATEVFFNRPDALRTYEPDLYAELAAFLDSSPDTSLADAAHTLQVGRKAFELRRATLAGTTTEAVQALRARDPAHGVSGTAPPV